MRKTLLALTIVLGLVAIPPSVLPAPAANTLKKPAANTSAPAKTEADPKETQQKGILDPSYKETDPLNLMRNVDSWVGQKISFEATFVAFSPYALDYKGALRTSKDYISFLVQRPDVTHHVIPLSELKLIFPRKKVDNVTDLESGDTILVRGKVFSAALGDPWVDVDEVILLQKSPENLAKKDKKNRKNHADD